MSPQHRIGRYLLRFLLLHIGPGVLDGHFLLHLVVRKERGGWGIKGPSYRLGGHQVAELDDDILQLWAVHPLAPRSLHNVDLNHPGMSIKVVSRSQLPVVHARTTRMDPPRCGNRLPVVQRTSLQHVPEGVACMHPRLEAG